MKRGELVNILIGITIALLPLYIRICSVDFQRTSKDVLLVFLLPFFSLLLPNSLRKIGNYAWWALCAFLFLLMANQWNMISLNVMFQCFNIGAGLIFLYSFYERHDQESIDYILNGMIAGCIIQSILSIPGYWGIDLYREAIMWIVGGKPTVIVSSGSGAVIGSLGNINFLSAYLGLTSLAMFKLKKHKWVVILPITAMLLNGSIMGIAALVAGVAYYVNLHLEIVKKWQIYFASVAAMVIYPFSGIGHDSGRIGIWTNILNLHNLNSVIFGFGPGWFPDQHLMQTADVMLMQEHNEYLAFFNIFGLLGIAIAAPLFFKFINKKDDNKIFSSIFFAAFINSYAHFSLHQSTIAIIILVAGAICFSEGNKDGINLDR